MPVFENTPSKYLASEYENIIGASYSLLEFFKKAKTMQNLTERVRSVVYISDFSGAEKGKNFGAFFEVLQKFPAEVLCSFGSAATDSELRSLFDALRETGSTVFIDMEFKTKEEITAGALCGGLLDVCHKDGSKHMLDAFLESFGFLGHIEILKSSHLDTSSEAVDLVSGAFKAFFDGYRQNSYFKLDANKLLRLFEKNTDKEREKALIAGLIKFYKENKATAERGHQLEQISGKNTRYFSNFGAAVLMASTVMTVISRSKDGNDNFFCCADPVFKELEDCADSGDVDLGPLLNRIPKLYEDMIIGDLASDDEEMVF